jgi:hypothetical protein
VSNEKIGEQSGENRNSVYIQHALLSGSISGSFAYILKGNLTLFDQKVKKNKIGMIRHIRVHLMGYWDDGHMTNYQKWTKTKAVALNYSFEIQFGILF